MNISEKTLKSREKQCFDAGYEAGVDLAKSAPAMYEALKKARNWITEPHNPHDSHCAFICNSGRGPCDCPVPMIDAAIQKAEGRQP